MKLYKEKAHMYDLFVAKTGRNYREEAKLIARQLTGLKTLLELGCGTGQASLALSKLGFDVTCSDVNKEILSLAKKKTMLRAKIIDMRKFKLKRKVDVILLLFNTLCYARNKSELKQTLRSCYDNLSKKGMVVIGITNPEILLRKGRDFAKLWKLNEKDSLIQIDKFKGNKLEHTFIFFNLDTEEITVDKHITTIFSTNELGKALRQNGFKNVRILDKGFDRYFFARVCYPAASGAYISAYL